MLTPLCDPAADWFHTILEYSWWKLLLSLTAIWIFIHLLFGTLYFLGIVLTHFILTRALSNSLADSDGVLGSEGSNRAVIYFKCFCFSVQTMSTIGSPLSIFVTCSAFTNPHLLCLSLQGTELPLPRCLCTCILLSWWKPTSVWCPLL
jgi:hypothetical protein